MPTLWTQVCIVYLKLCVKDALHPFFCQQFKLLNDTALFATLTSYIFSLHWWISNYNKISIWTTLFHGVMFVATKLKHQHQPNTWKIKYIMIDCNFPYLNHKAAICIFYVYHSQSAFFNGRVYSPLRFLSCLSYAHRKFW